MFIIFYFTWLNLSFRSLERIGLSTEPTNVKFEDRIIYVYNLLCFVPYDNPRVSHGLH